MDKILAKLSARERRLVAITGTLVVVTACFWAVYSALGELDSLNARISQVEQELINLKEQDARSVGVERAFKSVASEHSSAWTEQEIHDRLRKEIYTQALWNPQAFDNANKGRSPTRKDFMVPIPALTEGTLNEDTETYREYQLSLRIPSAPIKNILIFVERMYLSKQFLRIDSLEITRPPLGNRASVSMQVTRTIVVDPDAPPDLLAPPEGNLLANPSLEDWDGEKGQFANWEVSDCTVGPDLTHATDGQLALAATAQSESGTIYQVCTIVAGHTYRLDVDIAAEGPFTLSVLDFDGKVLGEEKISSPDGTPRRYALEFTVPGTKGTRRKLQAPHIVLSSQGQRVYVDNATLIAQGR